MSDLLRKEVVCNFRHELFSNQASFDEDGKLIETQPLYDVDDKAYPNLRLDNLKKKFLVKTDEIDSTVKNEEKNIDFGEL